MTNLDSILKGRDITLPTKVCLVKDMVFPVVMYGPENWTIKKAEHRRIDAFELWCWRRLLRVPWTARRSNQSILKEINPEYSLERLMLKLKFQYFGHLMWKADSFEKTLRLGKIKGRKRRGRQRMRCWMASLTQWTWVWVNSRSWWWMERPGVLQSMGSQRVRHDWATKLNWTELALSSFIFIRRLFSSSLLSAIRTVTSAYLMLLIFLLAILIPACDSSSPAFCMMCSACKLNNRGDNTALTHSFPNLEPIHCSTSGSNCCFLTCIQMGKQWKQ